MNEKIFGGLNLPINNEKINQLCLLKGWTFLNIGTNIVVIIFFDGKPIYKTMTGMPRFDIDQAFSEYKESYLSGFRANLNLTNFKNGKHTIRVIAKTVNTKKLLEEVVVMLNKDPNIQTNLHFDNVLNKGFRTSHKLIQNFIELCKIKPNDRILEIGSQYGRLTIPFTNYLNSEGSYEGLDIIPDAISSCKENITPKFSNFHFTLADVRNKWYNPSGKITASEYKLPYENDSFDFVYLLSVFTHMLPKDMENYLHEIHRVLKKGGLCLISYFLLNKNSLKFMETNTTNENIFKYQFEGYRSKNKENPEAVLAYEENFIKKIYEKYDISIKEPIRYGNWTGIESSYVQDFVIAVNN